MTYRLPPAEHKSRYVREKFDQIAARYDRFNDLITQGQHRRWKRVLVRRLALGSGVRGLDLCCGTGDIAARALAAMPGGGAVVAADFSPNMLRIAQRRLKEDGKAGRDATGHLLCADAMRLPFAAESLDFVTVGYGLRNVTSLEGCLSEVLRVLRPGGVLASLDVGRVGNRWLRPLADFYMFKIVPRIGNLLQPGQDMYHYLPHSTLDYPHQQALQTIMEARGFTRVEVLEFLFGASVIHLAFKPGPI